MFRNGMSAAIEPYLLLSNNSWSGSLSVLSLCWKRWRHHENENKQEARHKLTYCGRSSGGGHQQHQNVLNDVRLELVQVSGPVTACWQVYLQAEVLLTLEAGALLRTRQTNPSREARESKGIKLKFCDVLNNFIAGHYVPRFSQTAVSARRY